METMRFLLVTTHFPPCSLGGDAMFVKYLSDALTNKGHEVHVFHKPAVYEALKGKPEPQGDVNSGLTNIHALKSSGSRASLALALAFNHTRKAKDEVKEIARQVKPDVVHWHNTKGFIGTPVDTEGAISLYTAHDYYAVCQRSNLQRPDRSYCKKPRACTICSLRWGKPPQLWRVGPRRVLRFPQKTKIMCPSVFMSERLAMDGLAKTHVLRNFVPDRQTPASRSGSNPQLTFLGVLERHKGPQTLLEAFANSCEGQGFDLHFIGEGSLRDDLIERVRALGLQKRVFIHGYLPRIQVDLLLAESAALVVPSEWPENAPLSVFEAMSMGVPSLGSDQGGLPEVLSHESGSQVFPSGNTKLLAQAIISLWDSRDDKSRRIRARESYEKNYSPSVHLKRYMSIIQGIPDD